MGEEEGSGGHSTWSGLNEWPQPLGKLRPLWPGALGGNRTAGGEGGRGRGLRGWSVPCGLCLSGLLRPARPLANGTLQLKAALGCEQVRSSVV